MADTASNRILVTGGAGFIGSHVCELLLAKGRSVTVLDNFASGKHENLAALSGDLRVVEGSVTDDSALADAMAGADAVIHLAAEPSVAKSVAEPVPTHAVNYTATLQVLEAMRRTGVSRIVYASSAAVYTAQNPEPHREADYPDPSSPYGIDKLAGEFALRAYGRLYGINPTALRFFNIYGERQDPSSAYSGVISIFVNRLQSGQGITVFGDGQQSRDFVYVRDLADLIVNLVDRPDAPDLMNVGTGTSTTLNELIRILGELLGADPEVTYAAPRAGDILVSRADNARVQAFAPREWTPLPRGLENLLRSLA